MGRASGQHAATSSPERRGVPADTDLLFGPSGPDFDGVFAQLSHPDALSEPDWRTPNPLYETEAARFIDPHTQHCLDLELPVAIKLLKLEFDKKFVLHNEWYRAPRGLVVSPAKTCPQMPQAGAALAAALDRKDAIAVYCDYDVDGTSAGEALRRGLSPYYGRLRYIGDTAPDNATGPDGDRPGGSELLYGYADAQQGFGLTDDFVRAAHEAGAKMLVTLDCGTGQVSQVKLAQSLGMTVVVVDHHNIADNPAEFHLNPKLGWDGDGAIREVTPTSDNTGAQLAWKLAAATQVAAEGKTRPEHWQEALQLAGMGCLADMGSVLLHENRAFFWGAAEHPPPGIVALAERLGEDPTWPGSMVTTQAAMNLPKRTGLVSAADVGTLMAAQDRNEAEPLVDKLVGLYESAKPVRKRMLEAAKRQTGEAEKLSDGGLRRPRQTPASWMTDWTQRQDDAGNPIEPMDFIAVAVLDDEFSDYAGYTGPVAQNISRATGKPAVIFAPKGVDEHGQKLYKFSSRNDARVDLTLGGLITDPAMREACTLKKRDESGAVVEEPVVGGHAEVVSGACTEENLPKVVAAMQLFANRRFKETASFWPAPWDGAEAYLQARKVDPETLDRLEAQAKRLGPFTSQKQPLFASDRPQLSTRKASNTELKVSMCGTLKDVRPSEDEKWLAATLDFGDGVEREVRYPADEDVPQDRREWVLRVGKPGAYYLRLHHPAPEPLPEALDA